MGKDKEKAASKKGEKKMKDIKSKLAVPYTGVQISAIHAAEQFADESHNDARVIADMLLAVLRQGHRGGDQELPPAPQAVLLVPHRLTLPLVGQLDYLGILFEKLVRRSHVVGLPQHQSLLDLVL